MKDQLDAQQISFLKTMKDLLKRQWIKLSSPFQIDLFQTWWPQITLWQVSLLYLLYQIKFPIDRNPSWAVDLFECKDILRGLDDTEVEDLDEEGDEMPSLETSDSIQIQSSRKLKKPLASSTLQDVMAPRLYKSLSPCPAVMFSSGTQECTIGWEETDEWRKHFEKTCCHWMWVGSHTRPAHGHEKVVIADEFHTTLVWIQHIFNETWKTTQIGFAVASEEESYGTISYPEAVRLCHTCLSWSPPLDTTTGKPMPIAEYLQCVFDAEDLLEYTILTLDDTYSENMDTTRTAPIVVAGSRRSPLLRWKAPMKDNGPSMARDTIQYSFDVQVLLTTYHSSAYGVTLTQLRNGILFGRDRVAAKVLQLTHRMLRINQILDVFIYPLETICPDGSPTAEHLQTQLMHKRLHENARRIDTQARSTKKKGVLSIDMNDEGDSSLDLDEDLVTMFKNVLMKKK
jgi:hypothetical protein